MRKLSFLPFLLLSVVVASYAEEKVSFKKLDEQASAIKRDMLDLGRAMYRFEQQVMYPEEDRFELYLSMDVGKFFDLRSLRVMLENNIVFEQRYSPVQAAAFEKGAVQRLYINNLEPGQYELIAYFEGLGPRNRTYKRAVKHVVRKAAGAAYVELQIRDNVKRLQPEFQVKVL